MQGIESLGNKAAEIMMVGAVRFIDAQGLRGKIDLDAVVVELRKGAMQAVEAALAEAKVALENPAMDQVAEAGFAASMTLAGINAVKAVIGK